MRCSSPWAKGYPCPPGGRGAEPRAAPRRVRLPQSPGQVFEVPPHPHLAPLSRATLGPSHRRGVLAAVRPHRRSLPALKPADQRVEREAGAEVPRPPEDLPRLRDGLGLRHPGSLPFHPSACSITSPTSARARGSRPSTGTRASSSSGGWSPPYRDHGWGLLVGEVDQEATSVSAVAWWGITLTDREELERTLAPLASPRLAVRRPSGACRRRLRSAQRDRGDPLPRGDVRGTPASRSVPPTRRTLVYPCLACVKTSTTPTGRRLAPQAPSNTDDERSPAG